MPASFRKVLQTENVDHIILRKDIHEPCLVLYPENVWNEQMDTIRARLNRWNRKQQAIFRQFVSDVEPLTLDASGRFLIPRRFQEMAGITQSVRFIGVGDTIEIWASNDDSKPFMDVEVFGEALEELMNNAAEISAND